MKQNSHSRLKGTEISQKREKTSDIDDFIGLTLPAFHKHKLTAHLRLKLNVNQRWTENGVHFN